MQRLRRAGRTWDHAQRRRAGAAQVLVRQIQQLLVVRIGVDGGHRAALDSKRVLQHLGHGRQAVCRARGIRNHVVLLRVVNLVVHAEHKRGVWILGGRSNDHFLHRPAQVLSCFRALGEQACGFHHNLRPHAGPVEFRGVFHFEDLKALPFHADGVVRVGDGVGKVSKDRVVLQQVREGLGIRDVVHRHELDVLVVDGCAHDIAADAAEAVDSNLDWHYFLRWACSVRRQMERSRAAARTQNAMRSVAKSQRNASRRFGTSATG